MPEWGQELVTESEEAVTFGSDTSLGPQTRIRWWPRLLGVRQSLRGAPHVPSLMAILRTPGVMVAASPLPPLVPSGDRMLGGRGTA